MANTDAPAPPAVGDIVDELTRAVLHADGTNCNRYMEQGHCLRCGKSLCYPAD